jgi:hypothetical protein
MAIDLSNETRSETDELIPDGVYRLQVEVIPGGYGEDDILKKSDKGTLAYLNITNRVLDEGPYKGQLVRDRIMVETLKDTPSDGDQWAVKRGRGRVRRIVESARCVDVDHEPVETLSSKLAINSWGDIHGLAYFAQVGIEEANGTFKAHNVVESILTPADKDWPGTPTTPATPMRAIKIAKPARDEMDDSIPFVLAFLAVSAVTWLIISSSTLVV